MYRITSVFLLVFFLSGCGIMPGMNNPNTQAMYQLPNNKPVVTKPTLIRITPEIIAEHRVSIYYYHVAPADILSINIWQHPEFDLIDFRAMSNSLGASVQGAAGQVGYLVNSSGDIYFPMIGYVKVANMTVENIRQVISQKLKKYIKDPQVHVRVSDYRGQKVYVQGEITKPGFLPMNDQPLSIADALTLSGSIDPNAADTRHIYVIRGDFTYPKIYWLDARTPDAFLLAEAFILQPRDILYVSSAMATRWNRVLNQLLPTIQTIWYTQAIVNNA